MHLWGDPAAVVGEAVGVGWPPPAALVRLWWRRAIEDGIDDAPLLFDGVLAGEVARVAGERVREDSFVSTFRFPRLRREVDRHRHLANRVEAAGGLGEQPEGDPGIGVPPEPT